MRVPLFFAELENDFECAFFWDIEKGRQREARQRVKEERYWARRKVNAQRALYYYRKIQRVEAIDPWKMTAHIEPNFFGEKTAQFDAVKILIDKKSRILWVLRGLYHYLMFDCHMFNVTQHKKLSYTSFRRVYNGLLNQHREKIRQAKWDAKRAKVRAKREKSVEKELRKFGSKGHRPPAPVELLGDDWE